MKKLFALFICLFSIIGYSADISYEIDQTATATMQWKIGEKVVYPIGQEINSELYRVFLGVTKEGYYVVQEFYKNNDQKYTSPYTIKDISDITRYTEGNEFLPSITGAYQIWYPNGNQLYSSVVNESGQEHGVIKFWYENGQLTYLLNMQNGLRDGEYITWTKEGTLSMKGQYSNGREVGLWQYWNSQEELVTEQDFGN